MNISILEENGLNIYPRKMCEVKDVCQERFMRELWTESVPKLLYEQKILDQLNWYHLAYQKLKSFVQINY